MRLTGFVLAAIVQKAAFGVLYYGRALPRGNDRLLSIYTWVTHIYRTLHYYCYLSVIVQSYESVLY